MEFGIIGGVLVMQNDITTHYFAPEVEELINVVERLAWRKFATTDVSPHSVPCAPLACLAGAYTDPVSSR